MLFLSDLPTYRLQWIYGKSSNSMKQRSIYWAVDFFLSIKKQKHISSQDTWKVLISRSVNQKAKEYTNSASIKSIVATAISKRIMKLSWSIKYQIIRNNPSCSHYFLSIFLSCSVSMLSIIYYLLFSFDNTISFYIIPLLLAQARFLYCF